MTDEQKKPEADKPTPKKAEPKGDVYTNTSGVVLNFAGQRVAKGGEVKLTKKDLESELIQKKLARAVALGLLTKA
jgi:hypothetical protein